MFRGTAPITTFTISPTLATCEEVPKSTFSTGALQLPVGTSVTMLTVYGSLDGGASWGVVRDDDGMQTTIPVVPSGTEPALVPIPDICWKYPRLKFKSQAGAGDETARVFKIA